MNVLKKVKVQGTWKLCPAVVEANGKLKDRVKVNGRVESHPEGVYYLEWRDNGKRVRESVRDKADVLRLARLKAFESGPEDLHDKSTTLRGMELATTSGTSATAEITEAFSLNRAPTVPVKYRGDKGAIAPVVEAISEFVKSWGIHPDAVVPMPPSKQRSFQPVVEIAGELARAMNLPLHLDCLKKTKATQQMKDVGDFGARVVALEAAFGSDRALEGKDILLFDDLFQSGATMNVAARTLKGQGQVKSVYALALTRTRN